MGKRYIVAVDSSTKEQNNALVEFIRKNSLGWWHWLENFWLLTDFRGNFSAKQIRHVINETHPKVYCIVIELNEHGDTWSGWGPRSDDRNMFKWLNETWGLY